MCIWFAQFSVAHRKTSHCIYDYRRYNIESHTLKHARRIHSHNVFICAEHEWLDLLFRRDHGNGVHHVGLCDFTTMLPQNWSLSAARTSETHARAWTTRDKSAIALMPYMLRCWCGHSITRSLMNAIRPRCGTRAVCGAALIVCIIVVSSYRPHIHLPPYYGIHATPRQSVDRKVTRAPPSWLIRIDHIAFVQWLLRHNSGQISSIGYSSDIYKKHKSSNL